MNDKDEKFLEHLERKDKRRESGFSLGSILGHILKVPQAEKKDDRKDKNKGQKQRDKLIRYKNGKKVAE